jgi:hypothetical protein
VIQLTGRRRTRTSLDPRGTLVESYLKSRKLEIGDDIAGRVLRWHPGTSALVALFRSIRTDEPLAISQTFLNSQGQKLGRKFFGPVGQGAIKLEKAARPLAKDYWRRTPRQFLRPVRSDLTRRCLESPGAIDCLSGTPYALGSWLVDRRFK